MNMIKVYHGSYCKVSTPSLENGRMDADFGVGFYVTTDITMAEKWACRKNKPIMNEYLLNFKDLEKYSFGLDSQWLNFVIQNRNAMVTDFSVKDYDLLIGATADDKLFATIEQYESGFIDEETAIKVLNCMKVGNQICIRTEKGLRNLLFNKSIELTPERVNEIRKFNRADRILANQRTREIIQHRNQKNYTGEHRDLER